MMAEAGYYPCIRCGNVFFNPIFCNHCNFKFTTEKDIGELFIKAKNKQVINKLSDDLKMYKGQVSNTD